MMPDFDARQMHFMRWVGALLQWWETEGTIDVDVHEWLTALEPLYRALPGACQRGQCDQGEQCTGHCQLEEE